MLPLRHKNFVVGLLIVIFCSIYIIFGLLTSTSFVPVNQNSNVVLHVFMPHFHNIEVAVHSIRSMINKQSGSLRIDGQDHFHFPQAICVEYYIVLEEANYHERLVAQQQFIQLAEGIHARHESLSPPPSASPCKSSSGPSNNLFDSLSTRSFTFNLHVLHFPIFGIGGGSLLTFFQLTSAISRVKNIEFVVLCDTDVIILAAGWDKRTLSLLGHPLISLSPSFPLVAINPRSYMDSFSHKAEWNFLAFRYNLFAPYLNQFDSLHFFDFGHWWTHIVVKELHEGFHLWNETFFPIDSRSPVIVGDQVDPVFALHFFYSSRKRLDNIPEMEKLSICTDYEYEKLLQLSHQSKISKENILQWKTSYQLSDRYISEANSRNSRLKQLLEEEKKKN